MKKKTYSHISVVRGKLKSVDTNAYKKFGQNFLLDKNYIYFMIDSLDLSEKDFVIEIGPGMGALTEEIINQTDINNYLGIEIDQEKYIYLNINFNGINLKNISILDFDIDAFCSENNINSYKLIGSLPFNISKKIVQKFSECKIRPEIAVLMVQKEVGIDYAHDTGTGSSFLSVYLSQFWNIVDTEIVPAQSFFPIPKVDGMILVMLQQNKPNPKLIKFVKRGYGSPRKMLGNVLNLNSDNPFYNKRAHELSLSEWQKLFDLTQVIE
jgi:16S rRNA (adenine1518-N6/adenine1519-N6)-dimethyltransferase